MRDFYRFLLLFRPYRWQVAAGILLSIATLAAGISLLAVSGWFIAAMGIAGAAAVSMNYFAPAAMIRGLSIMRTAGRYGERLANHDAALRVSSGFREWFYRHLEPLAPAGITDLHSADILSCLRSDIDTLEKFYLTGIVPLCTAILMLLGLGVGLAFYHGPLAVMEIILLLFVGFLLPVSARFYSSQDEKIISDESRALTIDLAETIQGMAEYLVYGRMENQKISIENRNKKIGVARKNVNHRECAMQSITIAIAGFAVAGSVYLMIPIMQEGAIHPAEIAMVALLCLAGFDIVAPLPGAIQSFYAARIAAQRIFEITDRLPPARTAVMEYRRPLQSVKTLEVCNLSFSYNDKPVLKNISFALQPGEVIALGGKSGAGKSTMLDLLIGFRQPAKGQIYLNGLLANSYAEEEQRAFFSTSSQMPYLFADTLRANLMIANNRASEEEIRMACAASGLQGVIMNLSEELDTFIGERGAKISGGQIRRVSLARAMLSSAPILLLDEPTEGLDQIQTHEVMQSVLSFAKLRGQCVIICVHDTQKEWIPDTAKTIFL